MDEPVEVEATFDDQRRLIPRIFLFDGILYRVTDIGRRWDEEEWQHTLVMSPDGQTWDLAHSADSGAWRVRSRSGPGPEALI